MRKPKQEKTHQPMHVCSFCGKMTAEKKTASQAFGSGPNLIVIEKVPTISCSNCGEVYFDGDTLKELDRILLNKKTLAQTSSVKVAEFA
jgi:YgiT-type zinc finger domain